MCGKIDILVGRALRFQIANAEQKQITVRVSEGRGESIESGRYRSACLFVNCNCRGRQVFGTIGRRCSAVQWGNLEALVSAGQHSGVPGPKSEPDDAATTANTICTVTTYSTTA